MAIKIAVLGTRGFPNVQGGVEVHCENLYPRLVRQGCEVVVFTRKPYVNSAVSPYKGVTLISLSCPKNKFLESFLHTLYGVFVAKKVRPDIIHIHAVGPSLFIPVARILGLKVVMTNHGPDYERKKWGKLAKLILKFGESLGSRWANAIICVSESIARGVREKYNREVAVIPNGVTLPKILNTDETIKKYGLKRGKYILAVGRFVPEKGFHDLIDAFNQFSGFNTQPPAPHSSFTASNTSHQIKNSYLHADDWKLVIVGRADHEDRYSLNLKEAASKNNNVVLTGFLMGVPLQEVYSQAGLFVLPSYYEGLPIVLLEAMSYGLSCIASDIPANRSVELSENRFFKTGDVETLSIKLKEFVGKLLNEEEKRRQISMITERYDWEKIAGKTIEVYKKILDA